jgi:hypothetical protein
MNRSILSILFALAPFLPAHAATVLFNVADFTTTPADNRKVLITPVGFGVNGTVITHSDPKRYTTDRNGQFYASNVVAGVYDVEVLSPPRRTAFTITVTNTSDLLYAVNCLTVSTNDSAAGQAYNMYTADTRFVLRTERWEVAAGSNTTITTTGSVATIHGSSGSGSGDVSTAELDAAASNRVVVIPGTGGISVAVSKTNKTTIYTVSDDDVGGNSQYGSANLTNWSALAPTSYTNDLMTKAGAQALTNNYATTASLSAATNLVSTGLSNLVSSSSGTFGTITSSNSLTASNATFYPLTSEAPAATFKGLVEVGTNGSTTTGMGFTTGVVLRAFGANANVIAAGYTNYVGLWAQDGLPNQKILYRGNPAGLAIGDSDDYWGDNFTPRLTIYGNGNVAIPGSTTNGTLTASNATFYPVTGGSVAVTFGSNIVFGKDVMALAGANLFLHNYESPNAQGSNTFVGWNAGNTSMDPLGGAATLASANTGVGVQALNANTTGYKNTAVGFRALPKNTTGYYNTSVGSRSLHAATQGYQNTAVGAETLSKVTTAVDNTAVGYGALAETTGGNNTAVGSYSLLANTSGHHNTAIGFEAMLNTTSGSHYNTAIGWKALGSGVNSGVGYNVAVGGLALQDLTTGCINTGVGYSCLLHITTGQYNVSMGTDGLQQNTIGSYNTAVGQAAANYNIAGSNIVSIGQLSGCYFNGSSNVFIGSMAGYGVNGVSVGKCNTFIGTQAGYSATTGNSNILIGCGVELPTAATTMFMSLANLIYGNQITGSVGMGTNGPINTLDVAGTIGTSAGPGQPHFQGISQTNIFWTAATTGGAVTTSNHMVVINGLTVQWTQTVVP